MTDGKIVQNYLMQVQAEQTNDPNFLDDADLSAKGHFSREKKINKLAAMFQTLRKFQLAEAETQPVFCPAVNDG